ncbi:MAG: hypothetical protein AAGA18_00250 [Verrucomicrobiota bacterium]
MILGENIHSMNGELIYRIGDSVDDKVIEEVSKLKAKTILVDMPNIEKFYSDEEVKSARESIAKRFIDKDKSLTREIIKLSTKKHLKKMYFLRLNEE